MAAGSRRVGQTKDGATPLLKTVRGKPHATARDHDQPEHTAGPSQERLSHDEEGARRLVPDMDTDADPLSSSDEALRAPPKPSSNKTLRPPPKPSKPASASASASSALRKPPGSSRKRKAEQPAPHPEPGLRKPVRAAARTSTRPTAPRVPKTGQYEQGRTAKDGLEGNKENTTVNPTPPASSEDVWGFGMSSQPEQRGTKVTFGASKAKNIHVAAPTPRKGKSNPVKFGAKSRPSASKKDARPQGDGSDTDISIMSDAELDRLGATVAEGGPSTQKDAQDPELRRVKPRARPARPNGHAVESTAMDKAELDSLLKPTQRDHLDLTDTAHASLPPSSAPQEELDNIDSYMRELPAAAEEGTECAICHDPVDQGSYWDFWRGRTRTIKNQALYCHTHKKNTAQQEFLAEGYPMIDWSSIPKRIKHHRMALHKILIGDADTPSTYRTRYEPLALTGKAAAVPSKRADLSPSKQAELASYALDDSAVYPGYYGPRGRRLITESVMALLGTEIKRCSDAVVQTSGPATFVQAVLVPEVAVRLIMEDRQCDWETAEEVRERTYEMGVLLNEEIEDSVELGHGEDESEGENDYFH